MRGPVFLSIGLLSVLSCPVSRAAPFQADALDASRAPFRLKWISELGAESITVPGRVREETKSPSSLELGEHDAAPLSSSTTTVGARREEGLTPHERIVFAAVPGAVYAFSMGGDGPLSKLNRMRADSAIAYGFAVGRNEVIVAGDDGSVTLWSGFRTGAPGTVRWRRLLH